MLLGNPPIDLLVGSSSGLAGLNKELIPASSKILPNKIVVLDLRICDPQIGIPPGTQIAKANIAAAPSHIHQLSPLPASTGTILMLRTFLDIGQLSLSILSLVMFSCPTTMRYLTPRFSASCK